MTLEQRVCSLELVKRLKELGVPQKSFWFHVTGPRGVVAEQLAFNALSAFETPNKPQKLWVNEVGNRLEHVTYWVSAFTVAELGEMLPWYIESRFLEDADKWLEIQKDENADGSARWNISYQNETGEDLFEVFDSSEADARAKMLIYLLENKLITL